MEDLRDFRLFTQANLDLGKGTVGQYVRWVEAFLKRMVSGIDRDINYIERKRKAAPLITSLTTYQLSKPIFEIVNDCLCKWSSILRASRG
ncbi:MAG: hypothetical protein QXN08_07800 [Nitrososphaerales archaeon]